MKTLRKRLTRRLSLPRGQRVRLLLVSVVAFCVSLACSLLRRDTDRNRVLCYTPPPPTETRAPSATPSPTLTCYTATPSPNPQATATPAPESREQLLERLLVEGRFPSTVTEVLGE